MNHALYNSKTQYYIDLPRVTPNADALSCCLAIEPRSRDMATEEDRLKFEEMCSPACVIDGYPENGNAIMTMNDCRSDASKYRFKAKLSNEDKTRRNCAWIPVVYRGWPYILTVATKAIAPGCEALIE